MSRPDFPALSEHDFASLSASILHLSCFLYLRDCSLHRNVLAAIVSCFQHGYFIATYCIPLIRSEDRQRFIAHALNASHPCSYPLFSPIHLVRVSAMAFLICSAESQYRRSEFFRRISSLGCVCAFRECARAEWSVGRSEIAWSLAGRG